jgi:hypothetical protein
MRAARSPVAPKITKRSMGRLSGMRGTWRTERRSSSVAMA